MLDIDYTPERALVRLSGVVPNGPLLVQRFAQGFPAYNLRNGSLTISNEGFSLEDSEAQLGIPVTYRATSTPPNRIIQQNMVRTPDFSRGVMSWTAAAGRTINTAGHVTSNPSGSSQGVPGQTIAEVGLGTLAPNTTYLVTGKVKYATPAVWSWQDVRDFGTWAAVKAAKTTWQDVMTSEPLIPGDIYTTLYISLAAGATVYVAPTFAVSVPLQRAGEWFTFAVYVTTPASIPNTARLRLLHGTSAREFSMSWDLSEFGMQTQASMTEPNRLFWFSGDTPLPARPQDYLMGDSEWEDGSGDASITWLGTPGNSVSQFLSPSRIYDEATDTFFGPQDMTCAPIMISDPVASSLGIWVGLMGISSLKYNASLNLMDVLNRSPWIPNSSQRKWVTGELNFMTKTLEERLLLLQIFASGRVLLLRNPDTSYPESNWYVAFGDLAEDRTVDDDARKSERTWSVAFARVERPSGLIEASSGFSWKDVRDRGMTWAQLRDAYPVWLDVFADTNT